MLGHVFDDVLHSDVHCVFYYPLVQVADDILNDSELLEKFATCIQHFVREDILLSVDP